jgi:hypothetical protein
MPLRVNVGLSRKIGLPRYGSLGASCAVEVELDQGLLFHDADALHAKVQEAFAACRQAVADELGRQEAQSPNGCDTSGDEMNGNCAAQGAVTNGPAINGQRPVEQRSYSIAATQRQIQALDGIALRQRIDLRVLLQDRFGKQHLYELTRSEASRLIDELQRVEHASN